MGRKRKEDPIRFCKTCNSILSRKRYSNGELESILHFNKRPYCNTECMKKSFSGRKGPVGEISLRYTRILANDLVPKGPCSECGNLKGSDVHHIDANPFNNEISNLKRLCRSCHIKTHRAAVCSLNGCSNVHKGHGYCEKHLNRFKRHGDPLIVIVNGVKVSRL